MQNRKIKLLAFRFFCLCTLALMLISCNPTVFLAEDEALLAENKVVIKDRRNVDSPSALKYDLELNYRQIPNREFFFIPKEWYYYKLNDYEGNNIIYNALKKNATEVPSIHNEELMNNTAERMKNLLRNRKGYYYANVETKTKIVDKEATITYVVYPGKQFTIGNLNYICQDSTLVSYVDSIKQYSLLEPGSPIEENLFNAEKSRLATELQNLGFATFNTAYIDYRGDTSNYLMNVDIYILAPGNGARHKKFRIGDINVYTDHQAGKDTLVKLREEIDGIDYFSRSDSFYVLPKTINKRIVVKEKDFYSKDNELRTQQRLSSLNSYRFVRLNPTIDEHSDSTINYNFHLTPVRNKFSHERNINAYLTRITFNDSLESNSSFFLGFNGGLSLSSINNRNRAEGFSIGLDGNVEFNLQTLSAAGASINTAYTFPELNDLTRLLWVSERINLLPNSLYNSLNDYTTTNLNLTSNYSFNATIYSLASLNASFGFNYKPNIYWSTSFNQAGINFLFLNPLENFEPVLESNPYLRNAFTTRLLNGFILKDLSIIYNTNKISSSFNWGGFWSMETSGVEIYAANRVSNLLFNNSTKSEFFAKYVKFDFDQHFTQQLSDKWSFAGKFRTGFAIPFGDSQAVPYVRQFAVGGQNSVRGWVLRDLGPGGYDITNDLGGDQDAPFPYQSGDFLLESSLELRFPLYQYLKGAVFLDAGNVWVLSNEDERENSQLSPDFYKQIAIASGFGLRLDFTVFLIRFDLGYKVRNPFPSKETGKYFNEGLFSARNLLRPNLNLGVGLPF